MISLENEAARIAPLNHCYLEVNTNAAYLKTAKGPGIKLSGNDEHRYC